MAAQVGRRGAVGRRLVVLPCWGSTHFFPQLKTQHFSFLWQSLSLEHRSLSLSSQRSLNRGHLPKEEAVFESWGFQFAGFREAYVQVRSPWRNPFPPSCFPHYTPNLFKHPHSLPSSLCPWSTPSRGSRRFQPLVVFRLDNHLLAVETALCFVGPLATTLTSRH